MSERDDLTEQVFHAPVVVLPPEVEPLPVSPAEAAWVEYAKAEGLVYNMPNSSERRAFFAALGTTLPKPVASVQDTVDKAALGLDFMLDLQRSVETVWGRLPDPADPEAVSTYIREVVLCATDELHEVLAEVNWKPWKDSRGIKDISKYRGEMADVLHFILDLYLAGGLTGRDIVVDYMTKHDENLMRNLSAEYKAS